MPESPCRPCRACKFANLKPKIRRRKHARKLGLSVLLTRPLPAEPKALVDCTSISGVDNHPSAKQCQPVTLVCPQVQPALGGT